MARPMRNFPSIYTNRSNNHDDTLDLDFDRIGSTLHSLSIFRQGHNSDLSHSVNQMTRYDRYDDEFNCLDDSL